MAKFFERDDTGIAFIMQVKMMTCKKEVEHFSVFTRECKIKMFHYCGIGEFSLINSHCTLNDRSQQIYNIFLEENS